MQPNDAATDVLAAVKLLQQAREACADLKPTGRELTPEELAQRAKIIETVIRTRKLLKLLQGRADERNKAVDRLEQRREAMHA